MPQDLWISQERMGNKRYLIFAGALLVLTAGYGLFEARALIQGPLLRVSNPTPGAQLTSALFTVTGNATNISRLSINGRQVTVDPTGRFSEKLATPEGYGVVLVEAENRFGRTSQERVEFVGKPAI
jgi:hypothetical protein